jgi:two-component system, cell cycle sensor histidine kinase and response regulator CckA
MHTPLHNESEKRYQCILDNIEETYVEVDLDGKIVFFNKALSRLLGYSENELSGMGFENFTDSRTAEKIGKVLNTIRNNGTPMAFYDFEIIRKDGTKRWFEMSISLIRDTNGNETGFRGIGRDITSRKQREDDILRSLKLESVGILAGGIAHDFNNLLSILLGYISIAQTMVNSDDEVMLILKKAEKAAFQATELTKRLITFSRGDDPWRKITFLEPLLRKSMDFSIVGSGVSFSFSVPENLWPVNIDEGQIRQVVRNLVKNAAEAMPGGGIITISAENHIIWENSSLPLPEGTYVKWSVADQGIGIPDENLPKIFDPYFTTKDMGATKGMGLGLAICYSIIRKHDGSISVEPNKGGGTVFHLYLPAFPVDSRFMEDKKRTVSQ